MLWGLTAKEKALGLSFDKWVSGDYSAATDGLSQQINRLCLEEALKGANAGEGMSSVCRSVLGNHRISYPKEFSAEVAEFTQSNGQLMGCPLSFPILCAINVAAYWCALEEYTGRAFDLADLPCLVNGDDICFRANDAFYEVWKQWVARVGFTLSPGKNYISPVFVTVNSEGYVYRPDKRKPTFQPVHFLNTGLLYTGGSVERRVDWDSPNDRIKAGLRPENREMPFVPKINRVISESCDPKRTLLRVHAFYRDEIRHHTMNGEINMHAAPELGGLGVVLPHGCTTRFTPWQQKVAGYLRSRWCSLEFGEEVFPSIFGPPTREESKERIIDLNKPAGVAGRLTYQKRVGTSLSYVAPVKPGRVVVREKLEPLREGERRVEKDTPLVLNYQGLKDPAALGQWCIKQLSPECVRNCREFNGSRVLHPTTWTREVRTAPCARLADEPILARSDSSSVMSWVDDAGVLHSFLSKPVLA
jgi:hypothetical protein